MLLAVLTTWFVGTSAAWSEVYTEDFNSMSPSDFKTAYDVTDDPTAWYVINGTIDGYGGGSYTISNDVYRVGENGEKGKAVWTANGTNDAFIVTPKMQGKVTIYFQRYSKYAGSVNIYEATVNETTFTRGTDVLATKTYPAVPSSPTKVWESLKIDCGTGMRLAIVMTCASMDDFIGSLYEEEVVTETPQLVVKDNVTTLPSGYTYRFGLVDADATKQFQLTNPGLAAHNITVTAENGVEASLTETALAASTGESILTVTLKATTTDGQVTITSDSPDVEDFVINVTGTVKDPEKMFVDFADNALPEGWHTVGVGEYFADKYAWTVTDGYALTTASGADWAGALTTTEMEFAEDEQLMFKAQAGGGFGTPSLTVQHSADGTEWQNTSTELTNMTEASWKEYSVAVPATAKFIRFYGWNVRIDNIYGGRLLPVAPRPQLEVIDYPVGSTLSWGWESCPAGTEQTITLKNDGKVDLDVTIVVTDDYTVTPESGTVPANGGMLEVTIGTPAHDGDGVLTITPSEESGLTPYTINLTSIYKVPKAIMTIEPGVVDFGMVYAEATQTVTVSNTGDAELQATITNDNTERFEVSAQEITVAAGETGSFTIKYKYTEGVYGAFTANVTVTATVPLDSPTGESAVTIVAIAVSKNPNVWSEDFENGIPASWTNDGWTIGHHYSEAGDVKRAAAGVSEGYLVTPRLKAMKDDVLTFDFIGNYALLKVEYAQIPFSSPTEELNYETYDVYGSSEEQTPLTTITFTAPDDGYYYLRFSGSGSYLDNFEGFELAIPDVEITVVESRLPDVGSQYQPYTASVTVSNKGAKAQTVVARLLVNDEEVAVQECELSPAAVDEELSTRDFQLTYTPEEAMTDAPARIELTLKGSSSALWTMDYTLTIESTSLVWKDDIVNEAPESGTYDIVVRYHMQEGLNTIVLPFIVSDLDAFGSDAKAYRFDGYEGGTLKFTSVNSLYAETPYIIVGTETEEVSLVFKNQFVGTFDMETNDAKETRDGVTFQGSFVPIAAGELTGMFMVNADRTVSAATEETAMNGFHAYFDIPEPTDMILLSFDGVVTGIGGAKRPMDYGERIMDNGKVYDLQGRRVGAYSIRPFNVGGGSVPAHLSKGVYVVGGKKIVK